VRKSLYCLMAFFIVFGIHALIVPAADATINIMPLGNSVTRGLSGSSDQTGYRRELFLTLTGDGYDVAFVGSQAGGVPVDFDRAHEGHSGYTSSQIESNIYAWLDTQRLAGTPVDIILLHIGTNDIDEPGFDLSADGVTDILDEIDRYESDKGTEIWVILALIINRNCITDFAPCPESDDTSEFNDNLRAMALDRIILDGDSIHIVDMEDGAGIDYNLDIDIPPGDMSDDQHPFDTGYEKMADVWFSGIQKVTIPIASAGPDQSVSSGDNVTLDASNSTDHDNGNLSYQWVQSAGPAVMLSNNQSAKPTFTAPDVTSGSITLTFRVTVTDEDDLESRDWVNIVVHLLDNCPNDPNKIEPGICGCGVSDIDTDGDGTLDCNDACPNDSNKTQPGSCGCGVVDTDTDGDGTPDCNDTCPNDPGKTQPGSCGCGVADTDTDGDGTSDCDDNCPNDPNKIESGACGCGVADSDTDSDGTPDCNDNCQDDPDKTLPGSCGCGVADIDTDSDGTPDCDDNCPNDPDKIEPGTCGCGVADVDSDNNGIFDCSETNGDDDQGPGGSSDVADSSGGGGGGGGGCLISTAADGYSTASGALNLILLLGSILISLSAFKLQWKPKGKRP
jgi:lysophospholipase L1-like esterase